MKKTRKHQGIILIILSIILFSSCKEKEAIDSYANLKGNYFSIRQFAIDEWNTFEGQSFTILKTVKTDNKIDSSYVSTDTMNWTNIFKTFFATDISDRKYLGQYTFNQFDDNADQTHNFFYEAIDKDIYTQKLLITIDQYNQKVRGIYIETVKRSVLGDRTEKLYYAPMKTLQIQVTETPLWRKKKYSVTEYNFMR